MVFAWYQRRMVDEARRWGRQLLEAQDAERQRIARELHDDMVPRLYVARLAAERQDVESVPAQLGEVMRDLRTLAHELHPPALKHLDLGQALDDLVERLRSETGPDLRVEVGDTQGIDAATTATLFRVAQEALQNAVRHGEARTIGVTVERSDGGWRLSVTDDGRGFVPEQARTSFGLRSMRERVEQIGGRLEVRSAPGQGARVTAVVPE